MTSDREKLLTKITPELREALARIASTESELQCSPSDEHWFMADDPKLLLAGYGDDTGECQCSDEVKELYYLRAIPVKVFKPAKGCKQGCYGECYCGGGPDV